MSPNAQHSAEQARPGVIGPALRRVGNVIARVIGLALIVAAGVAGWVAADRYAFPDPVGVYADPANDSPWPDEFARARTSWDSFTLTYAVDGASTHRTSFDSTTDLVRLTYFDRTGATTSDVEFAGLRAYERFAGSGNWALVDETDADWHVVVGARRVAPVHLSALVPYEAFPFVEVRELSDPTARTDDVRRFEVDVDVARFRADAPLALHRWAAREFVDADVTETLRWVVDVRADGYIVRWEGRTESVETWSDYPADLVFESPLVAMAASAADPSEPTDAFGAESGPTTTVPG